MRTVTLSTAQILLATQTLKEMRGASINTTHMMELDRLYRLFERAENVTISIDNVATHSAARIGGSGVQGAR